VTVAIEHRGRLFYRRRPDQGLWAGLWEWPTEPLEGERSPRGLAREVVRRVAGRERGTTIPADPFYEMVHVLTHRRVHFCAYHVPLHGRPANRMEGRWLRCDSESGLPMSRAQVKLLTALKAHRTRFLDSEF
jgi:adenine-specific DNA glycosylase